MTYTILCYGGMLLKKSLSDTSIDAEIPSFPGSTTSLAYYTRISDDTSPSTVSVPDETKLMNGLREAVDFLHHDDAVLIAAELGDVESLERYINDGVNMHVMDHVGRNALHLAVSARNRKAVLVLLKAGVDPNVKDNVGMTPLSICLMRSPSWKMANLLFEYGAVILPRSTPTDTGLFLQFVIMCIPTPEEERILQLLIERGCLVNDPEAPGGRQALHFAAMSNNCTLARILLDFGADVYKTNHRHETPKQVAATYKCKEVFKVLEDWEDFINNMNRPLSVVRL